MVTEAINLAIAAGATASNLLVRGDSAYGYNDVIHAVLRAGARFSFVLPKNQAVNRAISVIPTSAWTPVRYPGVVQDPDTGKWISDAEVAEIQYTAAAGTAHEITARLIVRRVKDRNHLLTRAEGADGSVVVDADVRALKWLRSALRAEPLSVC